MPQIDLNADLGESFGAYTIGDDAAMLKIVSSANIACGFHGGDPMVMHKTITLALAENTGIGAHPGFDDLRGFGRRRITQPPEQTEKMLIYQIGAIMGMARACGAEVTHCKIHGALHNMASADPALAMAAAAAVKAIAPGMLFVVMPHSELEKAGERCGLKLAREVFADRAYDDNAQLLPRGTADAMIEDPALATERMTAFVQDGAIRSISGKRIEVPIDTICVHGDSPSAVQLAMRLRHGLESAGITIAPMAETLG